TRSKRDWSSDVCSSDLWSFASGGRHATWFGGYCPIYEADGAPRRRPNGSHESRTMLFPASRAQMTDVWRVIGLRGTASDSYSVRSEERRVGKECRSGWA